MTVLAPPATPTLPTRSDLHGWVREIAALTRADSVVWCDGSEEQLGALRELAVANGTLIPLDPERHPGSYLARSDPDDVARVEDRTYIASATPEAAGPTNNWREPGALRTELAECFAGSMRGRTMYVVPFSMGPVGGALSELGVEITDSPYVVLSMAIMTRIGDGPRELIEGGEPWVRTAHSVGMPLVDADGNRREDVAWPSNETKHIAHFPETREVWSFGSGYGGNALLGKKCFALRIASVIARDEGWLAEHMLVIRVISPQGRRYHVAAAFPSASGKTNMAMMQPSLPGWSVETVGDDIAWMRTGPDGRLRAINPESGLFGVAPGTGETTNPVAMGALGRDVIYTNVALTDDGDVWWEGKTEQTPEHLTDWRGEAWTPASDTPAAHPNARFTVAMSAVPSAADDWEDPAGVPIDAIVVGGRRATNVPLVAQSRDWEHGVFMGATVSSEQTAAAAGVTVGELRRDPFAMLPFCGYDMGEHWAHWLAVGESLGEAAPKIFTVNWFRRGDDGSILWPGFAENSRVLKWMAARLDGEVGARDTAAGLLPLEGDLDTEGLDLADGVLEAVLDVDTAAWRQEADLTEEFFETFGATLPAQMSEQLGELRARLA